MVVHFLACLLACPETKLGTEGVDGKETKQSLYNVMRYCGKNGNPLYHSIDDRWGSPTETDTSKDR